MDPLQELMANQPYQQGDFHRSGPEMRRTGPLDALMGAFDIHKPWGLGDTINAAMWAMPGMNKRLSPVSPQQPALGGDSLLTALRRDIIDRGRGGRPIDSWPMDAPSIVGLPQSIATSRKAQFEALKSRWNKDGPPLDFDEVWATGAGDRAWAKEVQAWNKERGTSFDPDNMPQNSSTQGIFDRFAEKFLSGKTQKFPGVSQANEHFENSGDLANVVHLKGKIPEEYR